jgi:hypothetical protein
MQTAMEIREMLPLLKRESAGNGGYGALAFHTAFNDSLLERCRRDASGSLLVGTSTARSNFLTDYGLSSFPD